MALDTTATPPYPDGWFTVHYGLRATDEINVRFLNDGLAAQAGKSVGMLLRSFVDGDGFTEWGEPRTQEPNREDEWHAQLATPLLSVAFTAYQFLERMSGDPKFSDLFVPLAPTRVEYGSLRPTHAFISGSEDWASGDDLMLLLGRHDWFVDSRG